MSSARGRVHADVWVLLPLWLMVFASSTQVMVIPPVLPRIEVELGIDQARLGLLVTGYLAALSCCALVAGPVSDAIGRRRILLLGTGAMTLMLALHALAFDFWSLLTVRMLAGAAGGVLTGSAVAFIGDYFAYGRRGWAAGWVMSGFSVGQIAGVPVGTLLAKHYGFRAPFVLFCAVMALAFVSTWVSVPQPTVRQRERLGVRAVLAGYRGLLAQRQVVVACLVYATMFFAVNNFVVYFPKWAESSRGLTAENVASLFTVGGIATVVCGPQAGRLSDRFGRKPLVLVSCWGSAALFAATVYVVRDAWTAYALFFALMVLLAMRLSPLQALMTTLASDEKRGTLMSLVVATGQLGGGLGAAIAGRVFVGHGFVGNTLLAAMSIGSTGVLVWQGLREPSRSG